MWCVLLFVVRCCVLVIGFCVFVFVVENALCDACCLVAIVVMLLFVGVCLYKYMCGVLSLFIGGCVLFVVCCLMFIGWWLVVGCWLLVVGCVGLLVVVCCVICCCLRVDGCGLLVVLVVVVCCLWFDDWWLVLGVWCLFNDQCHWLLVVGCNTSFIVCGVVFVCEWSLVVVVV